MAPRPLSLLLPDNPSSDEELEICNTPLQEESNKEQEEPHQSARCRSVCFASTDEIHPIIHRRDMSDKEIRDTWVHRLERRQSRIAIENTIFLMRSGVGAQLQEGDHFCARGLEHLYHEASLDYDRQVKKSQKIALTMQRMLRRSGKQSPEMIAKAYRKFTIPSRRFAYVKAEIDRAYVMDGGKAHERG